MATAANTFKVGFFLIAGFLLFNGALVWIGASHVLERRDVYVTYFDESVQGLDVGSPVRYRGVPVGRVAGIAVAPDGRLIEVTMDIAQGFQVAPELRASVATSGITGVSFVEIGLARAGAPSPVIAFTPPRRHIPSQPSLLASFTGTLTEVAAGLRGTDLHGLVADSRAAAAAARERLQGPEIELALARAARAADSLERLTGKVAALVEDPRIPRVLEGLAGTAERMQDAARAAQGVAADPRIGQALEDTRAATAALRRSVEIFEGELAAVNAGERLDAAQRRIERAADDVGASARAAAAGAKETTDTATAGARKATEAAARASERWGQLAAELDRSLQEVVVRIEGAAARIESLASSLEANPTRLLARPPQEDFR